MIDMEEHGSFQFTQVKQNTSFRDKISFELKIRQQPEHSRMCGVGEKSDRRPIDPPPIIQLQVFDPTLTGNNQNFLHNPYYFMYTTLISSDGKEELSTLADCKARTITGSSVSSLSFLKDDSGMYGAFFVFPDLSVRCEGVYKLKFLLFEIVGSTVYFCQAINSSKFTVYSAKKFPGMDESTPLTKLFAEQGLKIRVRKEQKPSRLKNSANNQLKLQPDNYEHHYINQGYQNCSLYSHKNALHVRNMDFGYMSSSRSNNNQNISSRYKIIQNTPKSLVTDSQNQIGINSNIKNSEPQSLHSKDNDNIKQFYMKKITDSNTSEYHVYNNHNREANYGSNIIYRQNNEERINTSGNQFNRGAVACSTANSSTQEFVNNSSQNYNHINKYQPDTYTKNHYGNELPNRHHDNAYKSTEVYGKNSNSSNSLHSNFTRNSSLYQSKPDFDLRSHTKRGISHPLSSRLPPLSLISRQQKLIPDSNPCQKPQKSDRHLKFESFSPDLAIQKKQDSLKSPSHYNTSVYRGSQSELNVSYNTSAEGIRQRTLQNSSEKHILDSKQHYEESYDYSQNYKIPNYYEYDQKDENCLHPNVAIRENNAFYFYNDKKRSINNYKYLRNESGPSPSYSEIDTSFQTGPLRTDEFFLPNKHTHTTVADSYNNMKSRNIAEHNTEPHSIKRSSSPKNPKSSGRIKVNDLLTQNSPDIGK
ncbi:hypothetical protein BB561_000137 [Smittium simulii]|uniref:Velvet domain-containing protein n=1 Tax=Smittium simulii TaxID=133385 RepID=A0A2T9Z0B2_9FUNG|nr:hypothetical protein BB561_000137 [Smittium simulii]